MAKGMQNRARVFHIFQEWMAVVHTKRRKKMTAAGIDGTYFQR
jgi:hypothetical protein